MPSNKKKAPSSEREASYAVGDRVKVNLHTGRIVDATVKAVIERTDRKRLQVDLLSANPLDYLPQMNDRGWSLPKNPIFPNSASS